LGTFLSIPSSSQQGEFSQEEIGFRCRKIQTIPAILLSVLNRSNIRSIRISICQQTFYHFLIPVSTRIIAFLGTSCRVQNKQLSCGVKIILVFVHLSCTYFYRKTIITYPRFTWTTPFFKDFLSIFNLRNYILFYKIRHFSFLIKISLHNIRIVVILLEEIKQTRIFVVYQKVYKMLRTYSYRKIIIPIVIELTLVIYKVIIRSSN